ncbi:MAG: di-trans,poly-cis-decaprenylcistransferase [Planctomycetia bacterium]|nr:di-trans,poly-cis-decaprenylcistransferase [Planctomycetia bacterium]
MIQSDCRRQQRLHVAIIMDGNGRWAQRRGHRRTAGHEAGGEAVRRVVEAAPDLGIGTLTLFAFAAANWQRPAAEVDALLHLFHEYLVDETEHCREKGVRLSLVGRRDRLPPSLRTIVLAAEHATRACETLHLRLAIDYSSRDAILSAARHLATCHGVEMLRGEVDIADFTRVLAADPHAAEPTGDVDLVIRTGGERRLSDFLLWESAFAELYFTDRMWPDFDATDLAAAIADFHKRDRRFGRVTAVDALSAAEH